MKNSASYSHKYGNAFMRSSHYFCQILNKLDFSQQTFENSSNIKVHENLSVWAELFHKDGRTDGRTDRRTHTHDETNSRFPQFCECAQKWIKHTNLGLRCRCPKLMGENTDYKEWQRFIRRQPGGWSTKPKCMFMSRHQHSDQHHITNIHNKSLEHVSVLKYGNDSNRPKFHSWRNLKHIKFGEFFWPFDANYIVFPSAI